MMESSVIVDIDSESRLMFATNSSGVVLISHFGTIGFSAEEFQYYQCLFKLTDTESIGKLRIGSTSLSSILRRSNLKDDVMEKLLFLSIASISDSSGHDKEYGCSISLSESDEVNYAQDEHEYVGLTEMSNGHKTEGGNASCGAADSSQFLSLHQWLLLCKLILQLQLNPWAAPDGSLLEVICSLYEFDNQHSLKTDGFTQPPSPMRLDDTPDGRGIVIEDKLNQGNRLSYVEKAESSNGHSEGGYTRNRKWKVPTYGCFANFRLGVAVATQDMITAARVAGWEVCSEGFQKPYTKFSVSVSTISFSAESKNKNTAPEGDGDGDVDAITATALRGDKAGGMGHLNGAIIPGMQEALPSNTSPSVVEPMPVYAPLVPVTTSVSVVSTPASVAIELPALAKASPEIAVTISPAPVGGKKNKKGAKKKTVAASVAVAASAVSSSVGGAVLDSALCAADSSLSSHAEPRVLGSVAPSSSCSSTSPSPVPPRAESGDTSSSTSSSNSPFYEKVEGNHSDIFARPLQHSFKDQEHQYSSSSSTDCSHHVDRDNCINAGCERVTDKEKGRRKETVASDIVYEGNVFGQFESQRRYSDFEALVSVLQRLYRGVILPPLPPKTWLTQLQQQTQSAQLFAVQRMAELQLFLSALLAHPLMRHSFEVSLFLRASKAGLNSFRLTFPLFTFDSNGAVIATCKNKNLAKSSTGYLSDATFTARAAAAGIVSSIWDLGSAFLSSNGYAVGDRRLRSGSNLSESSVTSNSNSDRGDRGDRVEENSPSGFDQRSKHQSITNGKVMTADKEKDKAKEKDRDRVQGCSGALERDAEGVKKERGCESAAKGRLEFAHRNPLSVAHTVVPSSSVGGASASAPCTDILKGFSDLSDSRGSPVNDSMAQYQQQQQWGGPVSNGHISTSEPSSSSSSGHYSASVNAQAPSDDIGGLCQVAGHGVIRGSHKDYRPECPIASTFNMTLALAPTPAGGEPLDSLEGSLQQLLKMLGAAGCVGDKLDALLSADGNNLYALSQFGYYLKQSADAHAAERWSLHTSTHSLNGAIETVAKSLQVFYEDQHKQNVTPVLFMGRYLQPTNAAIMQKARAASAVELSLLEEQHKKKALDVARKTKGVSEEVLSRCIDELAAAEEEVEGTRRDEARLGSLLKTESSSLIEIQKRSMQVYLHSFAASRAKQHAACLEVWEDLYSILADPTMPPSMISSAAWPSGEASGVALIERFL